jgi:hypothetical protein
MGIFNFGVLKLIMFFLFFCFKVVQQKTRSLRTNFSYFSNMVIMKLQIFLFYFYLNIIVKSKIKQRLAWGGLATHKFDY